MLTISSDKLDRSIEWDDFLYTEEWAYKNIVLNSGVSPITGNFQTKHMPHLKLPFRLFDEDETEEIVLLWSSQTAKTTCLFVVILKSLDTDPCQMQLMTPTTDGIPKYLSKKWNPFLNCCKSVKSKMLSYQTDEKTRFRGREILIPAGGLSITGSSRKDRKAISVKYFFGDEVAEMETGTVTESKERTKFYENFYRKIVLVSTQENPTDEISTEYDACHIKLDWDSKCPECEHLFYAGSKHFKYLSESEYLNTHKIKDEDFNVNKYKAEALLSVYVECPECKAKITNSMKNQAIFDEKYQWVTIADNRIKGRRVRYGLRANALATKTTSFETIAEELIDAGLDYISLDKVYRGYFNEPYSGMNTTETSASAIIRLTNGLPSGIIPKDTFCVMCGVDTQKHHFWFTVTAFTYDNIAHVIEYGRVENTKELELLMARTYQDEDGEEWGIQKMGIDRRGIRERTIEVDAWVESITIGQGVDDFLYLTEGVPKNTRGTTYAFRNHYEIETGKKKATQLKVMQINNLLTKTELSQSIKRNISKVKDEDGAELYTKKLFYINQDIADNYAGEDKSVSTDFEEQITSEEFIFNIDKRTGKKDKERTWVCVKKDNHLFDCFVACVALSHYQGVLTAERPLEKNNSSDLISRLF